jgi:glycosyltransferase involved in cell wall biosynthesis
VAATDVGEDGHALGEAGILLPVRPLEPHLGNALRTLVADPALRRRLGAAARRRAEERFGLRHHLDRVLAAYAGAARAAAIRNTARSPRIRRGGSR